jgi:hypothetical protein
VTITYDVQTRYPWKSILKFLEPFSIAKRFQTSKKALLSDLKPWGVAPNPTLLLKKEGRKLFY